MTLSLKMTNIWDKCLLVDTGKSDEKKYDNKPSVHRYISEVDGAGERRWLLIY
jgi:hypothetical protein